MTEGDDAFRCAWAFVDQLVIEGMEHACLSPGSRSTPLALALWRHPGVRVHVHLDERASAFFALGIAKATRTPVAVATTSGTAAAELFPAIVEASMSRVPLIALTADRPPELRGVGANQTIDQTELYGRYVKAFLESPVPGERGDEMIWRERGSHVAETALGHPPGPVHVNLPFREPLVPTSRESFQPAGRPRSSTVAQEPVPAVDDIEREIAGAARGVFLVGSLHTPAPTIAELARRLRWPVIAEPTSGSRVAGTLTAGQFLLANEGFASSHVADLVVQVGAAPTSRAGLAFVARAERLWILDPDDLVAEGRVAAGRLVADPDPLAARWLERLDEPAEDAWLRQWLTADARAARAVDATIDEWDEPYEGRVARDLAVSLPDGSALVVGSSMPVRDLDAYMRPREGLRVIANRGASGIDGFVSTALGVSATSVPTTALCGDLTLLHDVGSLAWSARRGHDCVFVVANNDGGGIFSFLPQRELPEFRELFTTPHGLDLAAVCGAAGASHVRIRRAGDLVPEVKRAREAGGVHVIEVPSDPDENVRRHAEVHAAVADALGRA